MIWQKIKTVAIIVLGLVVVILTLGVFDPFNIRKKPQPTKEDLDKERKNAKTKTELDTTKELVDLSTSKPGVDRDNALQDMLDKDYPK